jgi:hypothetical protein
VASSSAASGLSMNRERRGGESSRVPFACGFRFQPVMLDARDGQDKRRQDNRLGAANIQSPGREKEWWLTGDCLPDITRMRWRQSSRISAWLNEGGSQHPAIGAGRRTS